MTRGEVCELHESEAWRWRGCQLGWAAVVAVVAVGGEQRRGCLEDPETDTETERVEESF